MEMVVENLGNLGIKLSVEPDKSTTCVRGWGSIGQSFEAKALTVFDRLLCRDTKAGLRRSDPSSQKSPRNLTKESHLQSATHPSGRLPAANERLVQEDHTKTRPRQSTQRNHMAGIGVKPSSKLGSVMMER
ncbi:hypothetical protein M3J09_006552 [Ascochyta lentis]